MDRQILLTQQTMYDLLGYQTNLFRLPYGTYTEEAIQRINDQGLYIIQWDDVSGDPDPGIDARKMTDWVLQQVQPGSIIIMHANGRGWHTAEALPEIIRSLREQGLTLVTVSELLKIPPYK
jgi:peptidoglycan/xylan/chitin deacetylase (PgdA/CDA1 family)